MLCSLQSRADLLASYCYSCSAKQSFAGIILLTCWHHTVTSLLALYCHLAPCSARWHRTAISCSALCQAELTRWHCTATLRPALLAGTVLLSRALLSVKQS